MNAPFGNACFGWRLRLQARPAYPPTCDIRGLDLERPLNVESGRSRWTRAFRLAENAGRCGRRAARGRGGRLAEWLEGRTIDGFLSSRFEMVPSSPRAAGRGFPALGSPGGLFEHKESFLKQARPARFWK